MHNAGKLHSVRVFCFLLVYVLFPVVLTRAQQPTCLCCIGEIVAHPRVLPQLPPAQVQYPRAHGILQSPVQASGRVVLLLERCDARAPVRSGGIVMAL